jgi:hypothetical protein
MLFRGKIMKRGREKLGKFKRIRKKGERGKKKRKLEVKG